MFLHNGKTTDKLLKEAKELDDLPKERELDVLLSSGEQISMSKLSILLNKLGYPAISLTGWQAGIYTDNNYQEAIIEEIDTSRIQKELEENKIVIVAGFQGVNSNDDITTLGRGGSDTTAVALAASLQAKQCYIFSDVDGVYTTDPNKIPSAQKLENISYDEMLEISHEGAKVLHHRCVQVGRKYHIPIITGSTFNNKPGTIINDTLENTLVKSIVKNDDILLVNLKQNTYSIKMLQEVLSKLICQQILIENLINNSKYQLDISFTIKAIDLVKLEHLLETELPELEMNYVGISKLAIIGYGIMNNNQILEKILEICKLNNLDILAIQTSELKILILFKQKLSLNILEQFHNELI